MTTVAIAVICKTPEPGRSKTRLSPPLTPDQCAAISACFIRDLTANLRALERSAPVSGHVLYTPVGSEERLARLLPAGFGLVAQGGGDLGARLSAGIEDLIARGHRGAIIVSSDSPTLPASYFTEAARHLMREDCVVLCPAVDGGYTFIGLSRPHPELFTDMPWSTEDVYRLTVLKAATLGLRVHSLPMWYDVDDAASLDILRADLAGHHLFFAPDGIGRNPAPATRAFVEALALDHGTNDAPRSDSFAASGAAAQ
ncbi:MAG: TIGR04282 family arsenosugar biosynthesis glycosyltransferase [Ancalomicrobiaceae bacterium]|nr:TIGR04282 family arsenosugar biosynthesis glycosyltransferase [Ancalomicrobiaceae bacterium]